MKNPMIPTKKIYVRASKNYEISIGEGRLDKAGAIISKAAGGRKAVIVTDDIVASLYQNRLIDSLEKSGYVVSCFVFANGERSKNGDNLLSLLNTLAAEKLTRTDVVVALGGGVVGDLAGFAAACYMRGINYVQIPTTLLAAVDSSVGGKTGVNLKAGKNLAGAFYQPNAVICDVSLLSTISDDVYKDGCAEVIKYGVITDALLFEALKAPIKNQYHDIIARCIEIKRDIVAQDEFENDTRKLLNFGHTVGHAVEALSGYRTSHGQAVAAGMAVITRAATRMKICDIGSCRELLLLLRSYKLPINTGYDSDKIANACLSDKKRGKDGITMVFPKKIGECVLREIPVKEIEKVIKLGLEELA